MPTLGGFKLLPGPQPEYYHTREAYDFVMLGIDANIPFVISLVFIAAIVLIVTNRTAAAALLIAPVTVNVVCFHSFLDGGLFTAGASMALVLLVLNLYFLWQHRKCYRQLLQKDNAEKLS